jgi:formate/nitrite transporter
MPRSKNPPPVTLVNYDPKLTPKEVQAAISHLGIKKANTRGWQLFLLGMLAGLYISIGGHCFLVALEQGMGKIVGGAVFSVGLVLVVIAGAELFTGNVAMIVGTISRLYSFRKMLRNWVIVYAGNLVASYLCAALVFAAGLVGLPDSPTALGTLSITVAETKMSLGFTQAFIRGIFCNMLVILAIIMAYFSKDIISKIFCCILPIMAFVASGYEHCVANMYLIPLGFFAKGLPVAEHGKMFVNILPVTLGNIVGGILIMVIHPNRIRQIVTLFKNRPAQ